MIRKLLVSSYSDRVLAFDKWMNHRLTLATQYRIQRCQLTDSILWGSEAGGVITVPMFRFVRNLWSIAAINTKTFLVAHKPATPMWSREFNRSAHVSFFSLESRSKFAVLLFERSWLSTNTNDVPSTTSNPLETEAEAEASVAVFPDSLSENTFCIGAKHIACLGPLGCDTKAFRKPLWYFSLCL